MLPGRKHFVGQWGQEGKVTKVIVEVTASTAADGKKQGRRQAAAKLKLPPHAIVYTNSEFYFANLEAKEWASEAHLACTLPDVPFYEKDISTRSLWYFIQIELTSQINEKLWV